MAAAATVMIGLAACGGNGKDDRREDASDPVEEEPAPLMRKKAGAVDKAGGKVVSLTYADFKAKILDEEKSAYLAKRPCVIDFYATWCGPCREMAPVVEALAAKLAGKVDFYKVDVDDEGEFAAAFEIMSIPTYLFISSDGSVNTAVGQMPKAELESLIKRYCFDE